MREIQISVVNRIDEFGTLPQNTMSKDPITTSRRALGMTEDHAELFI
jgi:hypothetical protein